MRRLLIAAAAVVLLLGGGVAAWALWTAGSNPGGNGAAAATSVSPGLTPTATAAGQSVTVNWAPSTLASGQSVTGYLVKRYDAGTLASQPILSACDGTVTATSCVESNVPAGSWVYSVTPKFASNWLGAESPKSSTVTVLPAPTVTINQAGGQADPTNGSPITFTVVFSQSVTGFATGDVTLAGTAGATTATVTGSGSTFTVAVSGMTSNGTVIATVPAGTATNSGGTANTASTSTDNTVTRDVTAPTVTINQAAGQADPTSASPINFTVVFSESVTGFTGADITFNGTTGGTKVATVTGSGTTYNVAITGMTGDGTVLPSIAANVAQDAAGNNNTASTSTDNTVTYDDTIRPTVTINQAATQADPTNASPINFTVVFNEPVIGFATGDITFTGTTGGTKVGTVTGSGTTYNVAVTGMTGQGTVVPIIAAGVATDAGANTNAASTSTDNTVTRDTVKPSVTINSAAGQADPTNASPINFTVVFNEPVTGFATGDITFTGTTGGTKVGTVSGSGTTYTVAVTGMTGDGTVRPTIAAGVAADLAGNTNTVSTSTDNTVTYDDTIAPTVTINQAAGQADPTSASPINFSVVFSESVTGFTGTDITFNGTTGGNKVATVTGSGSTYNVAVTGMTGDGTVQPTIAAGVATDAGANTNTVSTSTDNTVTYDDTVAPTVTINQAAGQLDPASASPINFAVVFNETVTGFATGDVAFSGTAGGTKTGTVTGSGTTYNVAVTGMTTSGTVIATVAAGQATDAGANTNTASTSTDNSVSFTTCTTPGSATVTATADAWTDEASQGQNKGLDSNMFVMSKTGADNRALVKFTLPVVPAGCSVTSATLSVYNQSPVSGRTIDVHQAAAPWTETGVTWANQPATAGTAVGNTTTATAGLQEWSVGSQVQAQYAGTNNGFILRDRTEDAAAGPQQNYRSREVGAGNSPPQLVINWGP